MKRYPTSLTQVKIKLKKLKLKSIQDHYTPVTIANKILTRSHVTEDAEKLGRSYVSANNAYIQKNSLAVSYKTK